MANPTSFVFAGFVAIFALLALLPAAAADFTIEYCSSQNTGADSEKWFWTWQSNGWCTDKCRGTHAFAVIKEKDCWCSDYIPAKQDDISDCDKFCPGYKTETCGSYAGNRFVYVAIDGKQPSGTQGSPEPTSAKVSSSPTPSPTPTPSVEPSSRPVSTPAMTDDDSSSAEPTTFETKTSSSDPVTSNRVITISNGQVVTETIIITPTYSPAATSAPALTKSDSSGPNVAAIAGGVVGGVLGLCAIIGAILFVLWRRRKQAREDQEQDRQSGIARNTSTMSKAGLLRTEKAPQYPPQITTSFSNSSNKRSSRMMQDNESISPVSGSDRRNSRPYIFDQRLNPSAIMTFENTSRGSFASMDDSRDYGRTLNVRNPDPDTRD